MTRGDPAPGVCSSGPRRGPDDLITGAPESGEVDRGGVGKIRLGQPIECRFRDVVVRIRRKALEPGTIAEAARRPRRVQTERYERRPEVRLCEQPGAVRRRAGEGDERVGGTMPAARLRRRDRIARDRGQPFDSLVVIAAGAQLIDRLERHVRTVVGDGEEREPAGLLTGRSGECPHGFQPHHRRPNPSVPP